MLTAHVPTTIRWRITWNALRLAIALVAMALSAVNYQSNAAWMLTLLLATAAFVAIFHARRNLAGISGEAGPVPSVFSGERIPVPVVFRNHSMTPAIAVWATASEAGDAPAQPQVIPAGGSATGIVTLAPRHRGRYTVPALHAASSFPLGVIETQVHLQSAGDAIIYPMPDGRHLDEVMGNSESGDDQGEYAGDDFSGHRRPQPGDPPRHIDWKAVARGRPALMKAFSGGTSQCVLSWHVAQGDGEQRLSELARWVLDAEAHGWHYGLVLPGIALEPDGGIEHRERCLRTLALMVLS